LIRSDLLLNFRLNVLLIVEGSSGEREVDSLEGLVVTEIVGVLDDDGGLGSTR
jgi:hypothetical protein